MEKAKTPKLSGDLRVYVIFRADFKHTIKSRYSRQDALTFVHTRLQGKPLDLNEGISSQITTLHGHT